MRRPVENDKRTGRALMGNRMGRSSKSSHDQGAAVKPELEGSARSSSSASKRRMLEAITDKTEVKGESEGLVKPCSGSVAILW